jgi:hypothetical protein
MFCENCVAPEARFALPLSVVEGEVFQAAM